MSGELIYRIQMKNSGEFLRVDDGCFGNLERYANKISQLANFDSFYLRQIYPLFNKIHFAQTKNVTLLSYLEFFTQNLPLPLDLSHLIESFSICVSYNKCGLYMHRSIMYIAPIKPKKYPSASIQLESEYERVYEYLTKMVVRSDSSIREEEKNIIQTGFNAVNTALNISRAYAAIIKAGCEGSNLTKDALKNFYSLTERDYSRVRDLVKLAARNEIYPGAKIHTLRKTNKGLERVITPSFTLSTQNQKRLEFYSLRMNKTPEQTLNRVVHDFFTLLDKQQRLDKFKR